MTNKRNGSYPSDHDPRYAHLSENAQGTPNEAEKIAERTTQRRRAKLKERFVSLSNDMTGSPAWKALGSYARDAYTRIVRRARFNKQGHVINNGEIPMSVRELAEEMGVSRTTAHLMLIRLQLFGFLREGRKGHFGSELGPRRSTRWILTERATADALATRQYLSVDIRDANERYDKREFDLRRKKSCVTPRGTQNDDASPHGVRTRHPTGDTEGSKPASSSNLRTPTGDSLETSRQGWRAAAPDEVQGKIPPSSSKPKRPLGHHAKRSAAAAFNSSDDWKERWRKRDKARARELKKLARQFQQ